MSLRGGFADFPDELLLKVFSALPPTEIVFVKLTCVNWRRVASDNTLWMPLRKRGTFQRRLEEIVDACAVTTAAHMLRSGAVSADHTITPNSYYNADVGGGDTGRPLQNIQLRTGNYLHMAALRGCVEMIKILLAAGAQDATGIVSDTNTSNRFSSTAQQLARYCGVVWPTDIPNLEDYANALAPTLPVKDKIALAAMKKDEGNKLFASGSYHMAQFCYARAADLDKTNAVYPLNSALANMRLERYDAAVADCSASIALDKKNVKAWFRRASAFEAKGNFRSALRDYAIACRLDPENKEVQARYMRINIQISLRASDDAAVSASLGVAAELGDLGSKRKPDWMT